MDSHRKVLVSESGEIFYVRDASKDYHTQFGFLKAEELTAAENGSSIVSNTGKGFTVFDPSFIDIYQKIKRSPQMIPLKDIGIIISETGLGKQSKVVDAGTGSGGLACFLAGLVKSIVSYEIRQDFLDIAESNKVMLNLKNLVIKSRDVYQGIDERNVDLVCLDLPEPWKVVAHAKKALKVGGFLVSYSPTIPQVIDFVDTLGKEGFLHLKTLEIIERDWEIDKRRVRPKSVPIGHSGFITFARKVTK